MCCLSVARTGALVHYLTTLHLVCSGNVSVSLFSYLIISWARGLDTKKACISANVILSKIKKLYIWEIATPSVLFPQSEQLHGHLPHLELLHLARHRRGEGIDEANVARDLEVGDLGGAEELLNNGNFKLSGKSLHLSLAELPELLLL